MLLQFYILFFLVRAATQGPKFKEGAAKGFIVRFDDSKLYVSLELCNMVKEIQLLKTCEDDEEKFENPQKVKDHVYQFTIDTVPCRVRQDLQACGASDSRRQQYISSQTWGGNKTRACNHDCQITRGKEFFKISQNTFCLHNSDSTSADEIILGAHCTDMRHEKYRTSTCLSKHVWDLKDNGKQ